MQASGRPFRRYICCREAACAALTRPGFQARWHRASGCRKARCVQRQAVGGIELLELSWTFRPRPSLAACVGTTAGKSPRTPSSKMSRIRFLILEADIPAPPLRPPSGRHAGGGVTVDEPQLTAVRQNRRRLRGRENGDGLGRERIRAQKASPARWTRPRSGFPRRGRQEG